MPKRKAPTSPSTNPLPSTTTPSTSTTTTTTSTTTKPKRTKAEKELRKAQIAAEKARAKEWARQRREASAQKLAAKTDGDAPPASTTTSTVKSKSKSSHRRKSAPVSAPIRTPGRRRTMTTTPVARTTATDRRTPATTTKTTTRNRKDRERDSSDEESDDDETDDDHKTVEMESIANEEEEEEGGEETPPPPTRATKRRRTTTTTTTPSFTIHHEQQQLIMQQQIQQQIQKQQEQFEQKLKREMEQKQIELTRTIRQEEEKRAREAVKEAVVVQRQREEEKVEEKQREGKVGVQPQPQPFPSSYYSTNAPVFSPPWVSHPPERFDQQQQQSLSQPSQPSQPPQPWFPSHNPTHETTAPNPQFPPQPPPPPPPPVTTSSSIMVPPSPTISPTTHRSTNPQPHSYQQLRDTNNNNNNHHSRSTADGSIRPVPPFSIGSMGLVQGVGSVTSRKETLIAKELFGQQQPQQQQQQQHVVEEEDDDDTSRRVKEEEMYEKVERTTLAERMKRNVKMVGKKVTNFLLVVFVSYLVTKAVFIGIIDGGDGGGGGGGSHDPMSGTVPHTDSSSMGSNGGSVLPPCFLDDNDTVERMSSMDYVGCVDPLHPVPCPDHGRCSGGVLVDCRLDDGSNGCEVLGGDEEGTCVSVPSVSLEGEEVATTTTMPTMGQRPPYRVPSKDKRSCVVSQFGMERYEELKRRLVVDTVEQICTGVLLGGSSGGKVAIPSDQVFRPDQIATSASTPPPPSSPYMFAFDRAVIWAGFGEGTDEKDAVVIKDLVGVLREVVDLDVVFVPPSDQNGAWIGLSEDYVDSRLPIPIGCYTRLVARSALVSLPRLLWTVFLAVLTLLLDLAVSYPLYSALTLSTLTIFYFLRRRRCAIRSLRASVASVRSLVVDRLIAERRERGGAGEGYAALHLRDEIIHQKYTNPRNTEEFLTEVWPRVSAEVRKDNRVKKGRRGVGGKSLEWWEWVGAVPRDNIGGNIGGAGEVDVGDVE